MNSSILETIEARITKFAHNISNYSTLSLKRYFFDISNFIQTIRPIKLNYANIHI